MMSRASTALHEPEQESADYVTKLIGLGAVIVGKTKMTQFASSDEPTDQWIDFHCPFNPRGDMYQSPSGSSSGAAASLAGYSWLDYSVAGDCLCSITSGSSILTNCSQLPEVLGLQLLATACSPSDHHSIRHLCEAYLLIHRTVSMFIN